LFSGSAINEKEKEMTDKKKWNIGSMWKKGMPPSIKKKISERAKERYKTREIWNKGRKWSKETRKNISEGKKRAFRQHPELLKKMSRITKERWKNPKFRRLVDRKCTEFWRNHPNLKKEYSIKFRNYFRTHPKALKELLNYGKKSTAHYLKTKQGFSVKSKGEKAIADFLYKNSISYSYEAKPLMFREMICIPDFYLPRYKCFIEFYGGHPKAWKRKVKKNILYKKYKIPYIAITPAELNNLDYFLVKEAEKIKAKVKVHFFLSMTKI